jgi:uncharacterized protein YhbP (UPF0306 family)
MLFTFNGYSKFEEEPDETVDNSLVIDRISNDDIEVTIPSLIFTFRDVEIKLRFLNPNHTKLLLNKNKVNFIINGEEKELTFVNGEASFTHRFNNDKTLSIYAEDFSFTQSITAYPLWAILLPMILILLWMMRRKMKK